MAWLEREGDFEEYRNGSDIDGLTGVWSNVIEDLMQDPKGKARRRQSMGPKSRDMTAVTNKVPELESMMERKVQRIARRAKELSKGTCDQAKANCARRKQTGELVKLSNKFPNVQPGRDEYDLRLLYSIAGGHAKIDKERRVSAIKKTFNQIEAATTTT